MNKVILSPDSKGWLPVPDKKKNSPNQEPPGDAIEDPIVLNESAEEDQSRAQPEPDNLSEVEASTDAKEGDDPSEGESTKDQAKDEPVNDDDATVSEESPLQTQEAETTDSRSETAPEGEKDQTAQKAPSQQVVIRKGGFIPMFLGGVAAAAIGFGLAKSGVLEGMPLPGFGTDQNLLAELQQMTSAQQTGLADVESRISALESAPQQEMADPGPAIEDLTTQIGILAARIDALESTPTVQGGGTDADTQAALAAALAELDRIRAALDAQQAQVAALSDEAAKAEAQATLTAQAAMQRAAVTRVITALDAGTPYADALGDLRDAGVDIPSLLLEHAENGVATLAALQASFPDLAREALRAARQSQGTSGIGGFLETQLGLRSLQPRDGDDPDAILSRAEAALRDGRLSDALAELGGLPEVAADALANWRSLAETRVNSLDAAQSLAQSLNTN